MSDESLDTLLTGFDLPAEVHDALRELLGQASATWAAAPPAQITRVTAPSVDSTKPHRYGAPKTTERYGPPRKVASGGMAEVYAVHDRTLDREVALKVVRPSLGANDRVRLRFLAEARITARLQHPGIVPLHDLGQTEDGRHFFTMKLVEGRTLEALLAESPPPLMARMRWFEAVCTAVACAHSQGIVHRDLKPSNVMIGAFGEVLVMDWGVAKVLGQSDDEPVEGDEHTDSGLTLVGDVTGTPAYMAPEQARSEHDAIGPHTDVYALGLMLYEMLALQPARLGPAMRALYQAGQGRYTPLPEQVDPDLAALCHYALAPAPSDRPQDAQQLVLAVRAWMDGALKSERADAAVEDADDIRRELAAEQAHLAQHKAQITSLERDGAQPEAIWQAEDAYNALRHQIAMTEVRLRQALHAALALVPGHRGAELRLAAFWRDTAERAELEGDRLLAAQAEALVRAHDQGEHAGWLDGSGLVTLTTEPSGAPARLLRVVEKQRTLVEEFATDLGPTPLLAHPLPRGSWVIEVDGPAGTVRVPVHVRRGEHVTASPPGSEQPLRLDVPVDEDECYVPASWFESGGDADVRHPRPRRAVWVDGFVMRRHPVTHGAYITFLNALVDRGQAEDADRLQPRQGSTTGGAGSPVYRHENGRYALPEAGPGTAWVPDLPAFFVTWFGAMAYASWYSEQTGQTWRLPTAMEREKAARGADGRRFPWGNTFDPRKTNIRSTHPKSPRPMPIRSVPEDRSVYGIEGLAGNISDWLLEEPPPVGPHVSEDGRALIVPLDPKVALFASFAGGAWNAGERYAAAANLGGYAPESTVSALGLRLVRMVPGDRDDP